MTTANVTRVLWRQAGWRVEALCPTCKAVIGKFADKRAMECNAGALIDQVKRCPDHKDVTR